MFVKACLKFSSGYEKCLIYESVDLPGLWFEIKAYEKNDHRHIFDILRIIFSHNENFRPDSVDFERQPSTGSYTRRSVLINISTMQVVCRDVAKNLQRRKSDFFRRHHSSTYAKFVLFGYTVSLLIVGTLSSISTEFT